MNHLATPLCTKWNSFLLVGIALVVLGTIALWSTLFTTLASVVLFGGIVTAAGIFHIVQSLWTPE